MLLAALRRLGLNVIEGGGGGYFLRSALLRWRADVVHFHWLHPYLLRAGWLASCVRSARFLLEVLLLRITGQRIVWTVHNLHNHDNRHLRLERLITRLFFHWGVDSAIAHCPQARSDAAQAFAIRDRKRLAVIAHGSYIGRYADTISSADARARLGLPTTAVVFLFLGRIEPYKGVLELIETFRRLEPRDARLVVAGRTAGEDASRQIEAAINGDGRILFRSGYVADDQIQVFLRASDVFVVPCRDILTSSSVVLGMSFGKAIIGPARGCIPETVGTGGGCLFSPEDPTGLATALDEAYRRNDELAEMGAHNRVRAENCTWDQVAAATRDLYLSLVRGPK
jgi:glycosyltransferase involved in cell wall biosynthesis